MGTSRSSADRSAQRKVKPERAFRDEAPRLATRLEQLLLSRIRLGIITALATNESLSFVQLKEITETSDGNLSIHTRRLGDAGYVKCQKSFASRTPRTEFSITPAGRRALEKYLEHMEAIIRHSGTKA